MLRPVKLRQYLAFMKAKGYSAEEVLAGSGIAPQMLSTEDFLMDVEQSRTVVSNMIALSGDQGVGLEVGRATELLDLGLVGYVLMSAPSAREAVNYWINYSNSLVGMLIELRLDERRPDDWSLTISETVPLGFIYNFCAEEILVMSCRLSEQLTGTRPVITRIELSYPAPAHQALYAQHFRGPIRFNAARTRISFSNPMLDQPLRGNDKEFNEVCARQCELMMRRIGSQSPYAAKIRSILMRLRGRAPCIEVVADELATSPRTLRRRLRDEELSFQQVLQQFRADMAKEYLRSDSMTPKEVAYLLGFKDTNSFRRAFKTWTGKTIHEYRDER